ncbi:MAG: RNA methyltransferase [Dysgonamonadaceae bacterium]|jgi:TrmH family RNA methyltransferase|nr:RNA methyltransferase [Dysgonamonadaceae bacterium]
MLSKSNIKFIKSLGQKKYRAETHFFLAEGNKLVNDLIPCFDCELLIATATWLADHSSAHAGERIQVTQEDIDKASLLKNPQQVIGVFRQANHTLHPHQLTGKLSLALDGIQDPGNLGTIIRLADWFGIENIICSPDTVDIYNPKTVQASMGAIGHVQVHYTPLPDLIRSLAIDNNVPIYGAFLEGENIYHQSLSNRGLIVMGNEGNGISQDIRHLVSRKLYIPNYPEDRKTSESLNVALATAIICAEFRRTKNLSSVSGSPLVSIKSN